MVIEMIEKNIRINWISEDGGYIAAWIEGNDIICSVFDEFAEEAYFGLLRIICMVENTKMNIAQCADNVVDFDRWLKEWA